MAGNVWTVLVLCAIASSSGEWSKPADRRLSEDWVSTATSPYSLLGEYCNIIIFTPE